MTNTLVTHDGRFHADEAFSTVILRGLFPEAEIIRTRAPALIAPAEDRIVYDVGGLFDPAQNIFDHHQPSAPVREDATPFSSFGMIWAEYGKRWLTEVRKVDAADLDRVHLAVDRSFVRDIDALDNGVETPGAASPLNITRLIEAMSPDYDDETPKGMDLAFENTVSLITTLFDNHVRTVAAKIRAARTVETILADHDGGPVLELPCGMPWEGAARKAGAEHLLFAVIPRGGEWTLSCVRTKPGSFENKLDLPEAWAGLTDEALAIASGVPDATFCHRGRFFAVAKSREGIMAMVEKALEAAPKPDAGLEI